MHMSYGPIKLFIGLPIYAQVPAFFLQSLLALQARKPLYAADGREIQITIGMSQGDGVARSRNQLSADFLASGCTHLLFIDCDLIFSAEHVARIVSHDVPLVGGLYPKKQDVPGLPEWVLNSLPNTAPDEHGLQEVRYIGTGFMCIRRDVFEMILLHYRPDIEFTADYGARRQEWDFWPMGVYTYNDGTRRYLSEDWYFCQRWLDCGGKVLADTQTIIKHIGPTIFPTAQQEAALFETFGTTQNFQRDSLPAVSTGRARTCALDAPASPDSLTPVS